jgi:SGNH hydrolase-like domain, acetyltransferase AlgX
VSRRTDLAERLVFGLIFLAMAGVGLLTLTRPWLESVAPALYHDGLPPLAGMVAAEQTRTAGLAGVFDGSLQRAADAWMSREISYRSLFVRFFNETLYRVFAASYMNNRTIVFGRKHTLFERYYIEAYCGVSQSTDRAPPDVFARRLRAAQDWFASRGQRLIYAIAPSKTAWFPDRIGSAFRCPQEHRDRIYPAAIEALTAAGVTFVDGRAALEAARGNGIELFPRNGIHWNQLGAALFVDAFIEALRRDGVQGIPRLSYSVSMTPLESGWDVDLISLANLLWQPGGAPAPLVQLGPSKFQGTLRLVTVNDSFLNLPVWYLTTGEVFRQIDFYYYFHLYHRRYPDVTDSAVDPGRADDIAPILNAEIILLEEVEARWGGPLAVEFLNVVDRLRASAATP